MLVALAVIFLPMLVQGPAPDDGAGDVSLSIPEQPPGALETREMPLQLPAAPVNPDLAPIPDDPSRVVTVDTDSATQADALIGHEPADATAPNMPAAQESGAATPPLGTQANTAPVVAAPVPAPSMPAPVPAPMQVPPPTPTAASAAGDYVVNLGSYGNLANAKALLEQLRAAGLSATSDAVSIDGKPAARLRLGPYGRRADAEAARLKALAVRSDLQATVVVRDASAVGPAAAPPPAGRIGFAVQVGAFRAKSDAEKLIETLRKAGYTAFSESVRTDAGTLYRVRVGPEIKRVDAEQLREALASKLKLQGMVVAHP